MSKHHHTRKYRPGNWETRGTEPRAVLKCLLVKEEARLKEVGERTKEATAMAANVESQAEGKGDIANVVCFGCGKKGHYRDSCMAGGSKLCYCCMEMTDHVRKDCPFAEKTPGMAARREGLPGTWEIRATGAVFHSTWVYAESGPINTNERKK